MCGRCPQPCGWLASSSSAGENKPESGSSAVLAPLDTSTRTAPCGSFPPKWIRAPRSRCCYRDSLACAASSRFRPSIPPRYQKTSTVLTRSWSVDQRVCMSLYPCASCLRHVRAGADCPFCGAEAASRNPIPVPYSRTTRAALVFGAATMVSVGLTAVAAGGVSGCSSDTISGDASADASDAGPPPFDAPVATPYGSPPVDWVV